MSFMISAIYNNKDVIISADTKMNSVSGMMKYPDEIKVFSVDKNTIMGITGDFKFAKEVYRHIIPGATSHEELLLNFALALKQTDDKWMSIFKRHFEAVFMLAGHMQGLPYMKLIIFQQGKFQMYNEPFRIGSYQYFLSNPIDLGFDECRDLCEEILADTKFEDPQTRLERIVRAVASRSRLVNDKPKSLRV